MFPGQGSQYTGMGRVFLEKNSTFLDYFIKAGDVFGRDIISAVNNSDDRDGLLSDTRYSQMAIYTMSCAINDYLFDSLKVNKSDILCTIGHSLGDYSALYSSGAYEFLQGAEIVSTRGRMMFEASGDNMAMAAVIGLDNDTVRRFIKGYEGRLYIANYNDYFQIVISGYKDDILRASDELKENGARKVIVLNVNTASHCPLMSEMSEKFNSYLRTKTPCFKNIESGFFSSTILRQIEKSEIGDTLVKQLLNPVRWVESIETLAAAGADVFIEVGPGKVLSGLVRRILGKAGYENIDVYSTDPYEEIENIKIN
jgi:[acyl-carrier-protein] S-malonyltransferase